MNASSLLNSCFSSVIYNPCITNVNRLRNTLLLMMFLLNNAYCTTCYNLQSKKQPFLDFKITQLTEIGWVLGSRNFDLTPKPEITVQSGPKMKPLLIVQIFKMPKFSHNLLLIKNEYSVDFSLLFILFASKSLIAGLV